MVFSNASKLRIYRRCQSQFHHSYNRGARYVSFGGPIALALAQFNFPFKALVSGLFLARLLVPTIILGLGLLLVFQPIGLTGTYIGIVIAHFGITVPYVVRTTMMSLKTADMSCEEAARVHGAGAIVTFFA